MIKSFSLWGIRGYFLALLFDNVFLINDMMLILYKVTHETLTSGVHYYHLKNFRVL